MKIKKNSAGLIFLLALISLIVIIFGCTSMNIKLVNSPNAIIQPQLPTIGLSVFDDYLQISDLQFSSVISIYDVSGKLVTEITTNNRSIIIPFNHKGVFIVKIQNEAQECVKKFVKT